jgi:hypothetical protein
MTIDWRLIPASPERFEDNFSDYAEFERVIVFRCFPPLLQTAGQPHMFFQKL